MKVSKLALIKEAVKHKGLIAKLPDVVRMVKSYLKGEYKMNATDLLLPALGLVYVISPVDILPDTIPFVGALDDLAVLSLIIPKIIKEVDKFLIWEAEKKGLDGQVMDAEIIK